MSDRQFEFLDVDVVRLGSIAAGLVENLSAPLVIGLVGTLGAGKTRLVQMLVEATSEASAEVTSPTFTLVQSYAGEPRVHHLDAYRVADEDEFLELGVEELFDDNAWTIVEWADRVTAVMPKETLWIELRIEPDARLRRITMQCVDVKVLQRLDTVHQRWLATSGS